jgi:hypothetical protein
MTTIALDADDYASLSALFEAAVALDAPARAVLTVRARGWAAGAAEREPALGVVFASFVALLADAGREAIWRDRERRAAEDETLRRVEADFHGDDPDDDTGALVTDPAAFIEECREELRRDVREQARRARPS